MPPDYRGEFNSAPSERQQRTLPRIILVNRKKGQVEGLSLRAKGVCRQPCCCDCQI